MRSVKDKLEELEDMELVNKLDIINLKNELDRVSLTSAPSPETAEKVQELVKLAERSDRLKKMEKSLGEMRKMREDMEKDRPAGSKAARAELDDIRKRLSAVESAPPGKGPGAKEAAELRRGLEDARSALESAGGGQPSPDVMKRMDGIEKSLKSVQSMKLGQIPPQQALDEIRGRIDKLEASPPKGASKAPAGLAGKVGELGSAVEGLRADVLKLKTTSRDAAKASRGKSSSTVPAEILGRLAALEENISKAGPSKGATAKVPADVLKRLDGIEKRLSAREAKAPAKGGGGEELKGMIESVRSSVLEQGSEIAGLKESGGRIDEIEKKLSSLEKSLQDRPVAGDDVEELRNELKVLAASVPKGGPSPEKVAGLAREVESLRAAVDGIGKGPDAGTAGRIDSLLKEINALKERVDRAEKVEGTGMSSHEVEELKKLHGQFPVEEFAMLKDKMAGLEEKLSKTSRLAESLQPIELPEAGGTEEKAGSELEERVKSLEKMNARSVNPQRIADLERNLGDMKSRMVKELHDMTAEQLKEIDKKIHSRIGEMEVMKKELIENTIEQLLAQPGNAGRMADDKLRKQVDEVRAGVERLGGKVSPADAKITTLMRENDVLERAIAKLRQELSAMKEKSAKDVEELEIELKAMGSRMGTAARPQKGGVPPVSADIQRDLEILKTKAEWLESTVQKFNLQPIYEKLQDLEDRMGTASTGYSPMIIE